MTVDFQATLNGIQESFTQHGVAVEEAQSELQAHREERLRLQGRYAQAQEDAVIVADLEKQLADREEKLAVLQQAHNALLNPAEPSGPTTEPPTEPPTETSSEPSTEPTEPAKQTTLQPIAAQV